MKQQIIDELLKRYPEFEVHNNVMGDDVSLQLNCKDSVHPGGVQVCLAHLFELKNGNYILTVYLDSDEPNISTIGDLKHAKMTPYKYDISTFDELCKRLDKMYTPLVKIQKAFNQNDIVKAAAALARVGFALRNKDTCEYILNVHDYQIQIQLGYADAFSDEIILYNAHISDYSLGRNLMAIDSKEFIALTFDELKRKIGV